MSSISATTVLIFEEIFYKLDGHYDMTALPNPLLIYIKSSSWDNSMTSF